MRTARYTGSFIAIAIIGACLSACTVKDEAPPPNPALAQPTATEAPSTPSAPSAQEETAPDDATTAPMGRPLPKLQGFMGVDFGMPFAKAKKSKEIKKRCKDKLWAYVPEPEYADQKLRSRALLCTATIAERYAQLTLDFDHNDELYSVKFSFKNPSSFSGSPASLKQRTLLGDEVDKFVADVRAILEPDLGKPTDLSTAGLTGKDIHLNWAAETTDEPPHKAAVEMFMNSGLVDLQNVRWVDFQREADMNAAIEAEKNERVRNAGL